MTLVAALALLVVFVLMRVIDVRRQREVGRTANEMLSPEARATLDELAAVVGDQDLILRDYYEAATHERASGRPLDAVRTLNEGMRLIEQAAPGYLTRMRALARLARTLSVIVSLPPVRPYAFHAWRLRGLAGLVACAQALLVSGAEKVRLRLWFVVRAFELTLHWLTKAAIHAGAHPAVPDDEWRRFEHLVDDLETARREGVLTAARVVEALDVLRRRVASTPASPQR